MVDWMELADQAVFEAHVRAYTAAEYGAKALCVLDLGRHNALNFHTGSLDILVSDVRRTLPAFAVSRLASILEEHGVPRAFEVRRELVNFKKVCLHLFQNNTVLEKELRQVHITPYLNVWCSAAHQLRLRISPDVHVLLLRPRRR
jgi:hypothetical protein